MSSSARGADIPALTSLRFFAAFGVMVFHLGAPFIASLDSHIQSAPQALASVLLALRAPLVAVNQSGYLGVSFFFVLSGFILVHVYGDDVDRLDRKRFWFARFARVYPMYFVGLLIATPVILIGSDAKIEAGEPAPPLLLSGVTALFMVHAWCAPAVVLWNFPSWSVAVEAFFYVLFPWLLPWLSRRSLRQQLGLAAVVWAAGLALGGAYLWFSPDHLTAEQLGRIGAVDHGPWLMWLKMAPPPHLPEFIVGMVACRATQVLRERGWDGRGDVLSLIGAVASGVALWNSTRLPYPVLHTGLLAPLFACLIVGLGLGGRASRALSGAGLVNLGEASYAMYILHIPISDLAVIGLVWILSLQGTIGDFSEVVLPVRMVSFGVVLASAVIASRLFEHPARTWLRRWFERRERSRSAIAPEPVNHSA